MDAEQKGLLSSDSIVLECTSGNTGIALSMVGAAVGYRVTILMSESASHYPAPLIRSYALERELGLPALALSIRPRITLSNKGKLP